MSLDSLLTQGSGVVLDDLVSDPTTTDMPITNKATATNLSTHAALLVEPENAVDAYDQMMTEFSNNNGSQTMEQIIGEANKRENDLSLNSMADILGDDSIPVDQKVNYASMWRTGTISPVRERSPEELLQVNQLEKDGLVDNSDEVNDTRWDLAGSLQEVNNYNDEIQKMINQEEIKNDPSLVIKAKDFIETLVPFMEPAAQAKVQTALRQTLGDDDANSIASGIVKSMALMGESKQEIVDLVAKVPMNQRLKLAQSLYDIVTQSEGSITGSKNSLIIMNNLRDYLVEGQYTTSDRIIDDIASAADMLGIGSLIRGPKKVTESVANAARFLRRSPKTAGETLNATNAKSANEMLKLAIKDETGQVAQSVYGTSRQDAIVNNIGPEIGLPDDAVRYKPLIDDDQFDPDVDVIKDIAGGRGNINFSEAEKTSKLEIVKRDFSNPDVTGLISHREMTTVKAVDDGVNVRTVISPKEGGFKSAADALSQVKLAMRKYGVSDEEMVLLRRGRDGNYYPVDDIKSIKAAPSVKSGYTRYYYGSSDPKHNVTTQDDLWVTPDPVYARDYRRVGKDNTIWYVDIPNDKLVDLKVRDGINNYNISGKLSKEWAKKAKRLEGGMPKGNYAVGINHTSKYDPTDTIAWSTTDVQGSFLGVPLNIFDKLPVYTKGKGGSITQHLIPPSGYIDPLLTRGASVAVDQSAKATESLLTLAGKYAQSYKKLNKTQQKLVDNYILEANAKSLKFDPAKLRADGFTPEMMETVRKWKTTNDTLYVLENMDLVRQSKRKGFEMFVSSDGQDKFLIKPITNSSAGNLKVTKAYDSELGMIRNITSKERKELYAEGGTLAIARTPVETGGSSIPYVIVKNNSSNYSRALRETDQLLHYRDGHFTIYYKDPIFITKQVENADGTKYTKAIATAGNIKDAEKHLARLRTNDAANADKYTMRGDIKGEEFDEMQWNTRVNSGRTAQRTRGETLEDATSMPSDPNFRHIAPPEESIVRSINSISRRINMKEYLDTAKARFTEQYKEFLPIDEKTHTRYWPDNVSELRRPGMEGDKRKFDDALSTFRYIDQMENGFVNTLDDVYKNFFKEIADTTGKKGFTWIEKGARVAQSGAPTAWGRKKAFRLLLAANPVRQVVVQASQALPVILATNPTFVTKLPWQMTFTRYLDRGGDVESFMKTIGSNLTGFSVEEARALDKAYKESGISSAVSAHSLIRDDLKSLIARGPVAKTRAMLGKPLDAMQKYGFEAGENMLMRSVWLSEYDKLKKSGKVIDASALSNMHARVRDLTLNMNKAGELAYNENMFSAVMQFAQAPHKAFAQIVLGNRALSRSDRLRLGTAYVATYGTGYGLMYEMASKLLPEDDTELHRIVSGGLFNLAMNKTLSTIYGEDVDVDYSSSMRLLEIPHLGDMWESLATTDAQSFITSSPSLSLVVGDNAKVNNLIKSMARMFTVPEDEGNLKDVGVNFLSMFSGASNIFKARYAYKTGQMITTKGEVIDDDVNPVEAFMRTAGFQTVDEMLGYAGNSELYYSSKKFKDDIKYLMDETSRRLAREGISEKESDYVIRMFQEANREWEGNPQALQVIQSEIRRRIKDGDVTFMNTLLKQAGLIPESDVRTAIDKSKMTAEQKKSFWEIYNFMKEPE